MKKKAPYSPNQITVTPLKTKQNVTIILLCCMIAFCVMLKCMMLSRIKFDMDKLDTQINPIKKSLAFNSTVGFDSNLDDNESYEVYKALKYLLTPQVFLYKKDADTLIFVQYKGKAIKNLPNYRRVLQTGGDGQVIQLMVKTK